MAYLIFSGDRKLRGRKDTDWFVPKYLGIPFVDDILRSGLILMALEVMAVYVDHVLDFPFDNLLKSVM